MYTSIIRLILALFFVSSMASVVQADPLNLTIPHDPWVFSSGVYVDYSLTGSDTGRLMISGWPDTFNATPIIEGVRLESGSLELSIDMYTNGVPIGGTVTLTGSELYGDENPPILFHSTNLTAFGFSNYAKYEFLFTQEGVGIPPLDEPFGVVVLGMSVPGEGIDFTQPFSNYSNGQAETFYLPEPSSLVVLAMAGIGLIRRRRTAISG